MAGFAVDIGDTGSSYEQGVNMPASAGTVGAVAALQGLGTLFEAFAPDPQETKAPTESSLKREAVGGLTEALKATRGMNPLQQRTAVNAAITQYAGQGYELDSNTAQLVQTVTGINIDYLGANPQQAAIEQNIQKLNENPSYLVLAEQDLRGQGNNAPSQEQITELALQKVQKFEANLLTVANTKVTNEAEFISDTLPKFETLILDLQKQAAAALQIEAANGNVNPETIPKLRANLDLIRSIVTKPAGVSQEVFQQVQDRVDTLDSLLTRIETFDDEVTKNLKADVLNPIMQAVIKQAKVAGETDPLIAYSMLEQPALLAEYLSKNAPSVLEALDAVEPEALVYTDLELGLGDLLESITGVELPDGSVSIPTAEEVTSIIHDPSEIESAMELSAKDRANTIEVNTALNVRGLKPEAMNSPTSRVQFSTGIGKATVAITTSPTLVDNKTMSDLYNAATFSSLSVIKKQDPEIYQLSVERLKNALQAQANVFATEAKGRFETSIFTVTGIGQVELKTDNVSMPRAWTTGKVQEAADRYYDGNIYAMLRDKGSMIPTREKTELRSQSFDVLAVGAKYQEIVRYNEQFKQYANWWSKLGGDASVMENMIVDKQEEGQTDAPQGSPQNPFTIEWDENSTEDEAKFMELPRGSYFVDIDGNIRRKAY